jgi:hypothetical protein
MQHIYGKDTEADQTDNRILFRMRQTLSKDGKEPTYEEVVAATDNLIGFVKFVMEKEPHT